MLIVNCSLSSLIITLSVNRIVNFYIRLEFKMQPYESMEKDLLKKILEPLLDEFQFWFSESRSLFESERISFLFVDEQDQLLNKIIQYQEEVKTSLILFQVTNGETIVDPQVVASWHKLVAECWSIARKWRYLQNEEL